MSTLQVWLYVSNLQVWLYVSNLQLMLTSIWQTFVLTLAMFMLMTNFYYCKWPKMKK